MPTETECCCACRRTVPTQWLRIGALDGFPLPRYALLSLAQLSHAGTGRRIRHHHLVTPVKKSQRSVHPCSRIVEHMVDVPEPQIPEQIVIESKRKCCAWLRSSDSMATNIAVKLAARPTPYDNNERTWLDFRFTSLLRTRSTWDAESGRIRYAESVHYCGSH